MGGYDKPVATMLSPVHVGYSEGFKGPVYDPNKAKALLKEVGAPATGTFTLFTSPVFDQRIVVAIQQMLRGVGLKVEITSSDFGNWLSGLGGGGLMLARMAGDGQVHAPDFSMVSARGLDPAR